MTRPSIAALGLVALLAACDDGTVISNAAKQGQFKAMDLVTMQESEGLLVEIHGQNEHVKLARYSKIRYGLLGAFFGTPAHHREEAEIEEKALGLLEMMGYLLLPGRTDRH